MRYLTDHGMSQFDLEEAVAWEQFNGLCGNGDDTGAAKGDGKYEVVSVQPTTTPVTSPARQAVQPIVRADPYAGLRPRTPSGGVGTGSHAGTVITEAARTTRAPTPVRKEPAQKAPAKFDCAGWRTRRCAALARVTAAQGTVAQLIAAKASEGAVSMAQDNVAALNKAYAAINSEAGAAGCFQAQAAQRLCPGEKAVEDTSYMAPRGGYPAPFSMVAQMVAMTAPAGGTTAESAAATEDVSVALSKVRQLADVAKSEALRARIKAERDVIQEQARAQALREELAENIWLQKQRRMAREQIRQSQGMLKEVHFRFTQFPDAAERAWISKQRDEALFRSRQAYGLLKEIQDRQTQIEQGGTLQVVVAKALERAGSYAVRQADIVSNWRVLWEA